MIPAPPDPPVLDRVYRTQFKAFVIGLDLSPVPDVQDLRAAAESRAPRLNLFSHDL